MRNPVDKPTEPKQNLFFSISFDELGYRPNF